MTTSIGTTPGLAGGPTDGLNGTPHSTTGWKGRDRRLRTCRKINTAHDGRVTHEHNTWVPEPPVWCPLTDIASWSEYEDKPMDNNDTSIPFLARDGTREGIVSTLNGIKKMKIEKAGEHHSERSCSLNRWVSCKSGKP